MADAGRIYRRTVAGNQAVGSDDRSVPLDYRRILQLVSSDTHEDVIRGCLRQYPDRLLADWLAEIEELGLLESAPAPKEADLDFTVPAASAPVLAADARRLERDAAAARKELSNAGAYFALARLANRAPISKPPAQTAVLIVEDDPDQLALADLRVSLAGYSVRVAQSAKELVQSLRVKGGPDILLLDVMLPDGDGFDILAKMRRHPQLALLPVLMLTAKDDPADIKKGLALGADGYVTKPYSKNILVDAIRKVLKQSAQR
ncbi:MAG: response regulator [Betaproteobacteria bacterium]|nr:response regulator [Betaproteobacteria bacterium]